MIPVEGAGSLDPVQDLMHSGVDTRRFSSAEIFEPLFRFRYVGRLGLEPRTGGHVSNPFVRSIRIPFGRVSNPFVRSIRIPLRSKLTSEAE